MIKVNNLTKSFNDNVVFKDLSFDINENKVFGLIGINGSGKSTLLRVLSGIYKYDSGDIYIDGILSKGKEETKKLIFFIPDEAPFATISTINETYKIFSNYYDSFDFNEFSKLLESFKLKLNMRIGSLSKGMKKRLYLALGIASNTKYILLDETFDGLDPLIRVEVKKLILKLADARTFIIASHSLRDLEDIVDEFLILDGGKNFNEKIEDTTLRYLKYQLAYSQKVSKEMFEHLSPVLLEINGKFVTIVLDSTKNSNYLEEIKKTNPVVIDELEVSFEEYFISSAKEDL